jgi:hypothetical protein
MKFDETSNALKHNLYVAKYNRILKTCNAHLVGIFSWWNFELEYFWIFTHMLFRSYILVGGESKEVSVHATKLYDLYFLPNISWVIK